jgi:DNA (cytosine-5)-methyltransferase 1
MNYFDAFAGVGGFSLGIEKAYADLHRGHAEERSGDVRDVPNASVGRTHAADTAHCVGVSETDKYASAVLRYRFPHVKNYGDITKIDWSAVPDFDLLVGGSPCQDFSIAGKRAGLEGRRSGLFREYLRALEEKKPPCFIWENVKGVMSSRGGWDFASILSAFSEAGYALTWQVLNAKDFGVPQNRERVFVVGTRGEGGREVFFERGGIKVDNEQDRSRVANCLNTGEKHRGTYVRQPLRFLTRNQKNIEGDYAFTVDASQTSGLRNGDRIRRLTPVECERLMSWPDDWTKMGQWEEVKDNRVLIKCLEISDTQRYKMCGNGVVSAVVAEIVKAYFL